MCSTFSFLPVMSTVRLILFIFCLSQISRFSSASRDDFRPAQYLVPRKLLRGLEFVPSYGGHGLSVVVGFPTPVTSNPGIVDRAAGDFKVVKAVRGVRKLLFGALSCAPKDLSLTQGPVSSTSGIPTFNVQIVNLCGACAMADIHVACGNWASATPVDPFVFTRLGYNDCLVNNGLPLSSQGSVSFQYSNSAMYPMRIATATNECQR